VPPACCPPRLGSGGATALSSARAAKASVLCGELRGLRVGKYRSARSRGKDDGLRPLPVPMAWGGERGILGRGWGGWLFPARDTVTCVCISSFFYLFFPLEAEIAKRLTPPAFLLTQKYFYLPAVVRGDRGLS